MKNLRTSYLGIKQTVSEQIQGFSKGIDQLKTEFVKIRESEASDRVLTLTKIEAFDHWIDGQSATKEQMTARMLLDRVTTKMDHTLQNLKLALNQITTERDELQTKLEQTEKDKSELQKLNHLLEATTIEDSGNRILAVMRNLAPPISIFQYYQAFKPLILQQSNLPDIRLKTYQTKDQFKAIWMKANSQAKDLIIPKGVVEIATTNPSFYLTRFYTRALIHINQHHNDFYSNIENRNVLPQIDPYTSEEAKEIQDMATDNFPELLSALDELAQEESTQLHEVAQHHQNLIRKYHDSFPTTFQRIQLHGYVTRALEERKQTLKQRHISTPHARALLYLPQYDPCSMKISKRS